jgi:exopolysaccharide biosynthesis protein
MKKGTVLYLMMATVLVVAIGVGAYLIVDRLSGTSVSLAAVSTTQAAAASSTEATSTEATSSEATTQATPSYATTTTYASTDDAGTQYTATENTYTSDTTSITISKVTTGSGADTVTYYVADVQLKAGTLLQAGLADGFQQGKVDYTSSIAETSGAILAINGDYCTARDTGIIIRNGVLYLDNPTRTGLALYNDGTMKVYDEREVTADQLLADGVYNTYSFGPVLLDNGTIPDGLDTTEVEDVGQEHTILGTQPRTAVGIVDANHYVFVVVDGRSSGYSRGVTLTELAQILKDLGCTTAYNLDGGGSSAMYFNGELVNNPLGRGKERGLSDILYVGA